jgi:hypothetical protein
MSIKTSLAGGAALGVVLALASGVTAQAATRHHHRAYRHPAAAAPDHSSQLQSEIDELKAEVQSLKSSRDAQAANQAQDDTQISQLRSQLADADARAQAAQARVDAQIDTIPGEVKQEVAKAAPKTDKLYIKGATLQFGGFTALETVFRSKAETADMGSSYSAIPYGNVIAGHTSETRFSARQSRVQALAQAAVSDTVKITGYGEFDFLGAAQTANSNESNSYTPRIRNLYTQIDWIAGPGTVHFLGGQSWSLVTLTSNGLTPRSEASPLTIEAQYVPGFVWARQPQFRLSYDQNQHFWFGVSVESPATTYYTSGKYLTGISLTNTETGGSQFNSANSYSLNKLPDFVAKAAVDETVDGHKLHAEVFGLYRDFYARVDDAGVSSNESTSGGGVGGGVMVGLIPGVVDLQASGLWGKGVGRYGSAQLPDVTVSVDGTLHPIEEWEVLLGGVVHITKQLDVYAYAGEEREQANPFTSGTIFNGLGNAGYNNTGCDTEGSSNCVGNTHYVGQLTAGFWDRPYVSSWGKFQWGVQYSYTERAGFAGEGVAPITHDNMVFTSFRFYPF